MKRPFISSALGLAAVLGLQQPAFGFETFSVTGVRAEDTLALREQPFEGGKVADWKELGRIPADAENVLGTGRTLMVGDQRWAEVAYSGTVGWVNTTFLEAAGSPADLKDDVFRCGGTEPFWGVTLGPERGEYSDPEQSFALTTERVQPATGRPFPLLYRLKDEKGRSLRATVSRTDCSDGMSDFSYGFEVLLSGDDNFEQGCCSIQR